MQNTLAKKYFDTNQLFKETVFKGGLTENEERPFFHLYNYLSVFKRN